MPTNLSSSVSPSIVVAASYNGDIAAEYLLQMVYEQVDEIVLVEAKETYSGIEKERFYHELQRTHLAPFKSKLTILQIDKFPKMPTVWEPYVGMPEEEKPAWFREFYQRDIAKEYLQSKYGNSPYILICCDADEIINDAVLKTIIENAKHDYSKFNNPHYLEMKHFYFNCGWLKKNDRWRLAFVCNHNALINKSLTSIRIESRQATSEYIIKNGGWHCSFFASLKDIVRKIESYSHRTLDQPIVRDESHISKCLKEGLDIFTPLKSQQPHRGDTTLVRFDIAVLPKTLLALHEEVVAAQSRKN